MTNSANDPSDTVDVENPACVEGMDQLIQDAYWENQNNANGKSRLIVVSALVRLAAELETAREEGSYRYAKEVEAENTALRELVWEAVPWVNSTGLRSKVADMRQRVKEIERWLDRAEALTEKTQTGG